MLSILPFAKRKADAALGAPGSPRRERFFDWAVAACTAAAACMVLEEDQVVASGLVDGHALNLVIVIAASATLLWRRSHPEICLLAGLLASLASDIRTILAVAAYAVARYSGALRFWVYGVAIGLYLMTRTLTGTSQSPELFLYSALLTVVVPALFGGIVRRQSVLNELLSRQLAQVEVSVTHAARFAALEQRTRLAFELHDNVGHQATVLSLHAGALERRADLSPDARRIAGKIVDAACQVTLDFRRIVDTLADPDSCQEQLGERMPAAEFLMGLSRNMAAVGMSVDYQVRGRPRPLPVETEQLLCRISREALTNAAKHASGALVELTLTFAPGYVTLKVVTGPARTMSIVKDSGGMGLRGLRAAVAAADGRFNAHHIPAGGFLLEAALPLPAETSAESAGASTGTDVSGDSGDSGSSDIDRQPPITPAHRKDGPSRDPSHSHRG